MEKSSMLDIVLLLICVMGPLTVNIFALLAVIAGNELHVYGWELTVAQPVFDMFQSIFQVWRPHLVFFASSINIT